MVSCRFHASGAEEPSHAHDLRLPAGGGANGWFIVENPIKMDELGGIPRFQETPKIIGLNHVV